jgi:hypothetical protein
LLWTRRVFECWVCATDAPVFVEGGLRGVRVVVFAKAVREAEISRSAAGGVFVVGEGGVVAWRVGEEIVWEGCADA